MFLAQTIPVVGVVEFDTLKVIPAAVDALFPITRLLKPETPLVVGSVCAIPTLPLESIRIASAPPSEKAMVSAAGNQIPVLVSPVVVMAGSNAVPACTVVTPVADSVVNAPVDAVVAPIDMLLIVPTPVDVKARVGVVLAVSVIRFVYAAPSVS